MKKKTHATLCLLALMTMCALPAKAQRNDPDAAVKALTKVIKKWNISPNNLERAVEDICSKYKKEPSVYNGAAEAFWWNGADSARAIKYANKAIAIDSKYAPAYVLQGNIWAYYKDTLRAKKWYEKAITANPQSPLGYEANARIMELSGDLDGAVATLEKATTANPQYPFHLKAARIYERHIKEDNDVGGNMAKAIVHYEQIEPDSMECDDVVRYANHYRGMHDYNKFFEIVEPYLEKYSSDPDLNRQCLYSNVETKRYQEAEKFANRLIAAPGSVPKSIDYKYFVRTYMGENKYEDAIEISKKWMGLAIAEDSDKQYAIGKIAEAYKELGEFEKAEDAYAEYISSREAAGKTTENDINEYAKLYLNKADESNGSEKIAAYMKADSIYDVMANKFIHLADQALNQRFKISFELHPDPTDGYALPVCNRLISTLLAKSSLDDTRKGWLVKAYEYLGYYNVKNNHFRKGKEYYQKILAIDPNNGDALRVLNVLKKY